MTWHVSPEEWLLDFTVIPRGRARGNEARDVIDDRLRGMLAPPPAPAGIVIPTITASRKAPSPSIPNLGAPRPDSGPRPAAVVAPPPAQTGLTVELHPIGGPAPIPSPPPSAASMVIPSLTRPGGPGSPEDDIDDDDEALERLSPIGGVEPGVGIPRDDADDVFSAVAASAPLTVDLPPPPAVEPPLPPPPEPAHLSEAEAESMGQAESMAETEPEAEAEAEAETEAEPEAEAETETEAEAEPEPQAEVADELEAEAIEDHEEAAPPPEVKPAAPPPRPVAPAPPPVGPPPQVGPPRPPAPPTVGPPRPPTPEKAPPPAPPSAGPPRPPPVADKAARPAPRAEPRPSSGPNTEPGKRKRGWYDEVFGDYYGSITPRDADTAAELDAAFVQRCLELSNGMTLLDVACGDGRHAIAFAAMGLDVTGLDSAMPQLLRSARRNEASRFNFDILHGDMRALPRDRAYDVVTCLGSSFGYFDSDEQNRQCLQDMVEVLKPGGKIAIQVFNRDYWMGVLPCRSWWQGRGCLVLDVADMQFLTGRVRIHRTVVFEDGRQFEHHISIRAYSGNELARMLNQAGARVLEMSGGRETRGRFYGAASQDIWIFGQREG